MLISIRLESAYSLCHVNTIDAHPMRIQFDSLRMRIRSASQRASCESALSQADPAVAGPIFLHRIKLLCSLSHATVDKTAFARLT